MPRGKRNVEVGQTVATEENKIVETIVQTKEQVERKVSPILEKSKSNEKDNAPSIILSWIGTDGHRRTRTYTCSGLRVNEDVVESFGKTGPLTTISLSIEAKVIEKM